MRVVVISVVLILEAAGVTAGPIAVGAAPQGDPVAVASRIIKYNFPACRLVSNATRLPDGSIRAKCDGTSYRVFTVFDANRGKTIEVSLNCTAAKSLGVSCD